MGPGRDHVVTRWMKFRKKKQLHEHELQLSRHNIVNGIKQGSSSKKTDKHAADSSKAVCWE